MITDQNYWVYASVVFYIYIKIHCWYARSMYRKHPTLTSIPENNEVEEDYMSQKWVPKKKHEVLKAKYKCLKKLFQIYDASVIGILPESYATEPYLEEEVKPNKRRKKRSHRTKTDACAGTTEVPSGDISNIYETEKDSIATAVMNELKINEFSCTSTQFECTKEIKPFASKLTVATKANETVEKECGCTQTEQHPAPYLMYNLKRRPTRFQCFIQRIFGWNRDRCCKNYAHPNGHVYAASDNNITQNCCEKRRRKGLRFRRLRRPKKSHSEIVLRDVKSPVILTYVQSVQRNCLMDTTPRQCPIVGCRMISYGIINYNDHLNICHFENRKFICHYCHEGFEREYDKFVHENEHIGITKLTPPSSTRQSIKIASDTQTDPAVIKCDVPEDKIKKIVSFFDKISDPDSILTEIKKSRCSETNLRSKIETTDTCEDSSDSDKRTVSCVNLRKKDVKFESSGDSEVTSNDAFRSPAVCHYCGEHFSYRRQLSLHVDLEHRIHSKFSKFHSCTGILNTPRRNYTDMVSEDGQIKVQSIDRSRCGQINSPSTVTHDSSSDVSRRKSEESLSYDPSTNIVYYTSLESVKKPSVVNCIVNKVRSYKWEPGTKIIHV